MSRENAKARESGTAVFALSRFRGLKCLAAVLACFLAGCAAPRHWASDIEPPGLSFKTSDKTKVEAGDWIQITVTASEPDYGVFLNAVKWQIEDSLETGFERYDVEGVDLRVDMTHVAAGGAWGEEAECHLDVTLRRGAGEWRFSVIGYSGSQMGRDRIPTALAQAAKAVAETLAGTRQ